MKKWIITVILGILSVGLSVNAQVSTSGTADLRGYGKVTWRFSHQSAEFSCADGPHAVALQGKLLADMFWDAGAEHQTKTVEVNGAPVTLHLWPGYGALAAAQTDRQVVVWGADTEEALVKALKANRSQWRGASWTPTAAYPSYLDFYDLKAFKSYSHSMASVRKEGLESHWPFAKKFGIGALAFQGGTFYNDQCSAPGVVDWTALDYEFGEAVRNGGMVIPCPAIGEVPLWVQNRFPESMAQQSPTSMGLKLGAMPTSCESWGIPLAQRQSSSLDYLRRMMERYEKEPVLGGWHLYCGFPGVEMNTHGVAQDYSPAGLQEFRRWLREDRQLDLPALGSRWYGDPQHFKSWEEVAIPDENSFFGPLDDEALRVDGGWTWQRAGKNTDPSENTSGWIPVAMPPAQDQQFIPMAPVDFRVKFTADEWLQKHAGENLFLVCNEDMERSTVQVWLNGKYLGEHKPPGIFRGPFSLDVKDILQAGPNELTLRVPKARVLGPVFLTAKEPRRYPFLGRGANARFVDLQEWKSHGIVRNHQQMLEVARSVDANRPYILSAPGWPMADEGAALALHYGMGMQNTGRQAFYQPWMAGLGLSGGFYGTSEPGETTKDAEELSRLLGWILIDGDSSHNLYWSLEDYQLEEKKSGWFSRNKRLPELFGKSLRELPAVALIRSTKAFELGSDTPFSWDVGRGELQAAHYDNAYVTEQMVAQGAAAKYPVIMDTGTEYMDESTVQGIRRYVQEGGTFIALHNTGRHTLLEPNTWPIASLTGFKVVSPQTGRIRFADSLPIFHGWEGQEFSGKGSAVDWLKNDLATGDTALEPTTPDAVALARWPDGSVAVGYRPLGKGRVIVLGSTFWRNGQDASGIWISGSKFEAAFFEKLFSDLGVQRSANSSSSAIWARKFTTKNGLQEWGIAFNSSKAPVTGTVSFKAAARPSQVWDLTTQQPVAFEYTDDGWVNIAGVQMEGFATKVFGVKRADLIGGMPFWWAEKVKYWRKYGASPASAPQLASAPLPLETWRFFHDGDQTLSKTRDWQMPGFDASQWTELSFGKWNPLVDRWKSYEGKGLYLARFVIPPAWKGKRIVLRRFALGHPLTFGESTWTLNGTSLPTSAPLLQLQHSVLDVTDQLRPGENVLGVEIRGGFTWGGKKLSGIGGAISLEPMDALEESVDITGAWEALQADFLGRQSVPMPGKTRAKSLAKEVEIPAAWAGRDVFLRVTSPNLWMHAVIVNGQTIRPSSLHVKCFANQEEFNLKPFLQAGRSNRIELWPYTVDAQGGEVAREADMEITALQLGCKATSKKTE